MKKNRIVILALAFLMALSLLAGCTGSGTTADDPNAPAGPDVSWTTVRRAGVLKVGYDEAFPPMGFKDADGNVVGFDVDFANAVCSSLGITAEFIPIADWTACVELLNTGEVDCIWNGFSITEERKANITFSDPYMDNNMVLVVKAGSAATLADLSGKKVGLQAGSSAMIALDANESFKESVTVVEFETNVTALQDLEAGGVDAVLLDDTVAKYYITVNNKNFDILDEVLGSEEYAVGFKYGAEDLAAQINTAFKTLATNGTLRRISTEWFGEDVTKVEGLAANDGSYQRVLDAGKLVVGMLSNNAPMSFVDEDGEPAGIDVNIANSAVVKLGVEAEFVMADTIEELDAKLEAGEIDCIWSGIEDSVDNQTKYRLSGPYLKDFTCFISRNGYGLLSYESITSYSILTLKDSPYTEDFLNSPYAATAKGIIEVADMKEYSDQMDQGYALIGGMPYAGLAGEWYIKSNGVNDKMMTAIPLRTWYYCVACKTGDNDLADFITTCFDGMLGDGSLNRACKKYVSMAFKLINYDPAS